MSTIDLMQAYGVYGDGIASDITYGGVDDGEKDPNAKESGFNVWDE